MREFIGGRPGWSIDREMGLGEEVIEGLMASDHGVMISCDVRLGLDILNSSSKLVHIFRGKFLVFLLWNYALGGTCTIILVVTQ